MKKVMVLGSGGREHALGWKLGQSDEVSEVIYAPGNAGTKEEKGRNIPIDGSKKDNFPALLDFVKNEKVYMVVVGPEKPLADGVVDYFNYNGYDRIFGPTQRASILESDKFFSLDIMNELKIPQADSIKCYSTDDAINAINKRTIPNTGSGPFGIVIKARGLTRGKGVSVFDTKGEALLSIKDHASKYGREVLIAERLFCQEFSVFGISDGNKVSPLEISLQDHKPLFDGDKGPNTGGMGAYGPAPVASNKIVKYIATNIMTPVIQRMKQKGRKYKGFVYGGMIMTEQGPKVIEFNIRFGDPECQPAMMILKSDLYKTLSLSLEGRLDKVEMSLNPGSACCVVLASKGYPNSYRKGLGITGLEDVKKIKNVKVFHAGTTLENGQFVTSKGRVLGVTSYSPNGIFNAQRLAYKAVSKINVQGNFQYREDIANKALE